MQDQKLLGLGLLWLVVACQGTAGGGDCAQSHRAGFAVEISIDDPGCNYEGLASRIGDIDRQGALTPLPESEVYELSCAVAGDECVCRGGDEFGRYEVELTDREAGRSDVAILDITREAPPVCVQTDVVQRFDASGGAGGAGGTTR